MKLTINGKKIKAEEGCTVLEAALRADIYIPNLCYHPDLPPIGACRLCIVEIKGIKGIPAACITKAKEGMTVYTETPQIQKLRKNILWFILSQHPSDIAGSSQLKKVSDYIGIKKIPAGHSPHTSNIPLISSDPLFVRDIDRCILCGRCVIICQEVRKTGVLGFINRGIETVVGTNYDLPLADSACKFCEACVEVCPSGALKDKEEIAENQREKKLLPCTNTCPAQIDVSGYVKLIAEERFQDALELIREKVPFPAILGYVCDHPCEEECRRGQINEPIAIRALKRFVAEQDTGRWKKKLKLSPDTNKKVAIVGSGPAGLTAAWFLQKLGHKVTVFEALPETGGMMRSGIPAYRLPRDVLNREIEDIKSIGVKIKTNTKIESTDILIKQGFHAVFLAIGTASGFKMGIPGENDPKVLDGISLLKAINSKNKPNIGQNAVVIGGGNVAIDAARSLLRAGTKKVEILYRRTRKEMPALAEEVEEALKEGVLFNFLTAPQKILPGEGRLKIESIRMKLGTPDASGRRRPIPIPGSEFIIETDRLITAIGQKLTVPEKIMPLLNEKGRIKIDPETMSCRQKGIFAGGDAVSGPASVIKAIQAGRKAAISIDKYLGGKGKIGQKFISEEQDALCLGRDNGFACQERIKIDTLPLKKRLCGFMEVEKNLSKKKAVKEAERCLRCQLRLKISRMPLPPEKNKPR